MESEFSESRVRGGDRQFLLEEPDRQLKYLQETEKYKLEDYRQISVCLLAVPNVHIQAGLHDLYFPIAS